MFLTSVILVLREVLEAAMIISVLLAVGSTLRLASRWLWPAVIAGLLGAMLLALNVESITEWMDGVGQEVINALLHAGIYFCLAAFVVLCSIRDAVRDSIVMNILLVIGVAFAITREGSEIFIYITGFASDPDLLMPVLLGSLIGAAIGVAFGVLVWVTLLNVGEWWSARVGIMLLLVIAAGMANQTVAQLIQADFLPTQMPAWDTTRWLDENTITGQLMYALLGYEATPTPLQVVIYLVALLAPLAIAIILRRIVKGRAVRE